MWLYTSMFLFLTLLTHKQRCNKNNNMYVVYVMSSQLTWPFMSQSKTRITSSRTRHLQNSTLSATPHKNIQLWIFTVFFKLFSDSEGVRSVFPITAISSLPESAMVYQSRACALPTFTGSLCACTRA